MENDGAGMSGGVAETCIGHQIAMENESTRSSSRSVPAMMMKPFVVFNMFETSALG
jgi:hypothetical protein